MQTIKATFRITTPMFLAGADQKKAELRVPSIKGALRFWWRATAFGQFGNNWNQLKKRETALFGSSDSGQSAILIRLDSNAFQLQSLYPPTILRDFSTDKTIEDGARYLGYGAMEAGKQAGKLIRACIVPNQSIDLTAHIRSDESAVDEILDAWRVLGLIGGLGSKSRKGYGSLTLLKLQCGSTDGWRPIRAFDELFNEIKRIISKHPFPAGLPMYSAISSQSRILIIQGSPSESPLSLLNRLGRELIRYRSWGHNGKILGNIRAERNFPEDHHLMVKRAPSQRDAHPRRTVFGLPHNYGKGRDQQVLPDSKKSDRRASPLFFHIHQPDTEDPPIAVVAFLPAQFLPDGMGVSVGGKVVPLASDSELWAPIHTFLNRLKNSDQCKEQFDQIEEVRV